ncbi:MAG TPA: hypothetical protein VF081_13155 [Solirubrobacterales bacterium]
MRRRRHQVFLGTFVALLVFGFAATAAALQLQTGSTVLEFDARVSPKTLTKTAAQAAAVRVSGRVFTTDGSVPSALTQLQVKVDNDVVLDTAGLPVCRLGQIQAVDITKAARVCRRSLLGRGTMAYTVAFPGSPPLLLRGRVLIFNSGSRRSGAKLLAYQYSKVPIASVAVTPVRIRRAGRHGLSAIATVPRIAGGAGFLTSFSVKLRKKYSFRGERKSVISASCGHRRIRLRVRANFANGGSSQGSLTHGCKGR